MIPKSVKVGGVYYKVEFVDDLLAVSNLMGRADTGQRKIDLQKNSKAWDASESGTEQVFWHEMVHIIFDEIGRHELSKDETLINSFSGLLYAVLKDNNFKN